MKEVSENKKTQFRWFKPMSKELLKFLADEVEKGNRPNNTFKSSSFVAAADTISKKFNVKCLPDHVDNHLICNGLYYCYIIHVTTSSNFCH